jgi:hypothetical protein
MPRGDRAVLAERRAARNASGIGGVREEGGGAALRAHRVGLVSGFGNPLNFGGQETRLVARASDRRGNYGIIYETVSKRMACRIKESRVCLARGEITSLRKQRIAPRGD